MNATKRTSRGATGFTLVEILISLAITALLLVAMGGAFSAASSAVEMNDKFFRSLQQARAAEDMIMTVIRRCKDVTSANSTSVTLDAATGDFQGHNLTFTYNTSGTYAGQITVADNTAGTTRVLASNVSSATFSPLTGPDFSGNSQIAAVSLSMTVQIGTNQLTLSDSASPRVYAAALYQ